MPLPDDQRRLLGRFLRAHREALAPAAHGLVSDPPVRRRTPGLRREEVAHLSGLSTTWYTWLEQGRDIALSAAALDRLARALALTATERSYVFALAERRDPAPLARDATKAAPSALAAALRVMTAPAYLLDDLWRACGWNDAAGRLFAPWFESGEPLLLRFVFLVPAARDFVCDWQERARRLVAEFRADTAERADDPRVKELLSGLRQESADFVRFWNDHVVLPREGGERRFNHPDAGLLTFDQITFVPSSHRNFKLVMLLPSQP